MYFLGIVHPPPSPELDRQLAPGFSLSREQLLLARPLTWNIPITLEHSGIFKAIEHAYKDNKTYKFVPSQNQVKRKLDTFAKSKVECTVIGAVIDWFEASGGGFYTVFRIEKQYDAIVWLIQNAHLTGLSLTHVIPHDNTTNILPYEVTLCTEPARPHCYIISGSQSVIPIQRYKRLLQRGVITDKSDRLSQPKWIPIMATEQNVPADMETSTSAPPQEEVRDAVSDIELALNAHPEEGGRKLIAARLIQMQKELETKQKEIEIAQKKQQEADVNTGLLKSYVAQLKANLGQQTCRTFCIDDVDSDISSNDPQVLKNVFGRVVHAASKALMEKNSEFWAQDSAPAKRKEPVAEPEPVLPVAASAAAASSSAAPLVGDDMDLDEDRQALKRAIASSWSLA